MKNPPNESSSFQRMATLASDLRDPNGGCPWDQKLTLEEMARHLIEEAYEVADSLRSGDMNALKEELGDLQFHIAMISQLAKEQKAFDWPQVTADSVDKLVERHPHVYGSTAAKTSEQVEGNWEQQKAQKQLEQKTGSILDSVSQSFPALLKAHKLGKKAAAVGFDWGDKEEALPQIEEKMREEWAELSAEIMSGSKERQLEEFGDYLFVVAQYGRKLGLDPEEALTGACSKFIKRFKFMEEWHRELLRSGQKPTLDQWEEAWAQAKSSQQSIG